MDEREMKLTVSRLFEESRRLALHDMVILLWMERHHCSREVARAQMMDFQNARLAQILEDLGDGPPVDAIRAQIAEEWDGYTSGG